MREDLLKAIAGMADDDGSSVSRISLQPGATLIEEGEEASSVYVLLEGALTVVRSVSGDTAKLAEISDPGSIVGEMVSMGGGTRSATVEAQTEAELLAFPAEEFRRLLEDEPDFTQDLVALAIRRAEESELAELLADHFGLVDDDLLMSTCAAVDWRRLGRGEVLISEGDTSDAVYFVVRGRLEATRFDTTLDTEVTLGEASRGDVVGEMGLLGEVPRTATLTAVRDTVVARLEEQAFFGLVDRQPRLMIQVCLNAVARAENRRWHASSSSVLALAVSDRLDVESVIAGMEKELQRYGKVGLLSPGRVESLLSAPGVANAGRGEIGDVRLSKLVHELELESDHMILDVGRTPGPWARRVLGMADQLLVVVPHDLTRAEASQVSDMIESESHDVHRTVVITHPPSAEPPVGSGRLRDRFNGSEVIHIEHDSAADLARLARVTVGRGNALVLGGGGGRGFAHIGVLRALEELDIPIDIVGGASIGGIIGSVIADAWQADRIVDWAGMHFSKALDYTIPVVSLIKGRRIARSAESTFGDRELEDLWHTFFCVSTNLSAARIHLHRTGSIAAALRATSAIPGVMPPVPFGQDLLVDGGVLNNLPIDVARKLTPHGHVIAVDVAPVRGPGAHGDFGLSVSGWEALRSSIASNGKRYPKMAAVLMRSMISASMRERDIQTDAGLADCYLDLDMRGVAILDFDDPSGVAERGYEAALPTLEAWNATI